jgi:hypothetical protein
MEPAATAARKSTPYPAPPVRDFEEDAESARQRHSFLFPPSPRTQHGLARYLNTAGPSEPFNEAAAPDAVHRGLQQNFRLVFASEIHKAAKDRRREEEPEKPTDDSSESDNAEKEQKHPGDDRDDGDSDDGAEDGIFKME